MTIPRYWAEAKRREKVLGRWVTLRRFGWSDVSGEAAQAHADSRLEEAFARVASGEKILKLEKKTAYNGGEGIPIREEIVAVHGEAVITRNSYGARCLNHPRVFFADIDCDLSPSGWIGCAIGLLIVAAFNGSWGMERLLKGFFRSSHINFNAAYLFPLTLVLLLGVMFTVWSRIARSRQKKQFEREAKKARARIDSFVQEHPEWHLRVYRTPAGFRLLAMHRTFLPGDPEIKACFEALGVDPNYSRMCLRQQCFRARVSGKPWRMGIRQPMRPRPGIWPVAPNRLAERTLWIEKYEKINLRFAACAFVETIGSGGIDPEARAIQVLHDELSQATSGLPTA